MANLTWNQLGYGLIPDMYLYPSVAAAQAAIQNHDTNCINWNGIVQKNMVYNELSLKAGSKVIVSVWIKEQQDCHCSAYQEGNLAFNFRDKQGIGLGNGGNLPVYASGNIIDGWQRIEALVTIPTDAASIEIIMRNDGGGDNPGLMFFDDLRIHPFNSNMKSYVYDDLSLRLMAELDENNYASFYEYDDDGSLVRVKKETEEGIKTIKETRNALVKDPL
jgi:hypothetical protein